MIIAAFSGVGKTYFCNQVEDSKDFVCMPYKYFLPNITCSPLEGEKVKADRSLEINLEYPQNYINALLENMNKYKYLVIPSDSRVLKGIEDQSIPYILCYPETNAKEEYRKRYQQRGNTDDFIDVFIGSWNDFMEYLRKDKYGVHVVLNEKEYLLDAKKIIDEIILCPRTT